MCDASRIDKSWHLLKARKNSNDQQLRKGISSLEDLEAWLVSFARVIAAGLLVVTLANAR
jgi:hypothetical protein